MPAAHYGLYGVEAFFVISGFVIFMTLGHTRHPLDSVVSRFSRLYPVYWASMLLTLLVVSIVGLPGYFVTVQDAVVNLSMLQGFTQVPAVDSVYWTLTIELSFYFVMFLLYCARLLPKIEIVTVVWLVMIVAFAMLVRTGVTVPQSIARLLCLDFGNYFIAGIMFYRWKEKGASLFGSCMIIACALVPAIASGVEMTIVSLVIVAMFVLFATDNLGVVGRRPFVALGAISYPLYLTHQNIGRALILRMESFGINAYVAVSLMLVIALAIATLLHLTIELPALETIRRHYRSVKPRLWWVPGFSSTPDPVP